MVLVYLVSRENTEPTSTKTKRNLEMTASPLTVDVDRLGADGLTRRLGEAELLRARVRRSLDPRLAAYSRPPGKVPSGPTELATGRPMVSRVEVRKAQPDVGRLRERFGLPPLTDDARRRIELEKSSRRPVQLGYGGRPAGDGHAADTA